MSTPDPWPHFLARRSALLDAAASLSERLHPGRVVRLTPEDEFFVLFGDGRVRDTLAGPGLVELRVGVVPRRAESGEGFELPTFTFTPRGVLLGAGATLELAAALGCALQEAAALGRLLVNLAEAGLVGWASDQPTARTHEIVRTWGSVTAACNVWAKYRQDT